MKTLEKEQDKIQQICDALRKETLEPAQTEALQIVENAKAHAAEILHEARKHAEKLVDEAHKTIEKDRNIFHSSLTQATQQSLEALRQTIDQHLFNPEIHAQVVQHTTDPKIIAHLIKAIIHGLEKEGLDSDLTVHIAKTASPEQINALLGESILKKLRDHSVTLNEIGGGVKVRLEGKRITLDISDKELEDLLKHYVRKDFRNLLFAKST